MDIFKEDKHLFKTGAFKSAFLWSLLAFPIVFLTSVLATFLIFTNFLIGILILIFIPNIVLFLVYYFSLKKGISKFKLKTYSLRLGYVTTITVFVIIFIILSTLILTGEFQLPIVGVIPVVIAFLVPYFIKK